MRKQIHASDTQPSVRKNEQGAALIFALSLLAIFGFIGVAYVDYMNTSLAESDLELRKARARNLAVAGIEIAAAGLREEMLSPNQHVPKGAPATFDFTTYRSISVPESGIESEPMNQARVARTTVTVYDENGRVNLNHAPASALQKMLGVGGDTARAVAASVPRGVQGPDPRWFLSTDELLSRGLLTQAQYELVVPSALTTYTVVDNANPSGYFNANTASAAALAAMLNITVDQAEQVKAKGPFATMAALGEAVASVTGVPAESVTSDSALALKSRCFRVVCEGFYAKILDEARYDAASAADKAKFLTKRTRSRIEAVLMFQDDGMYDVLYWNAAPELAEENVKPAAAEAETPVGGETPPVTPESSAAADAA